MFNTQAFIIQSDLKKSWHFLSIIFLKWLFNYKQPEQIWYFTLYYIIFYCKLQYSVVKILLVQNFIDKKNPVLVRFDMVKSFNFAVFLPESVSSFNISSIIKLYSRKFAKLKIFCLKNVFEIFISKLTSATKVLQARVF